MSVHSAAGCCGEMVEQVGDASIRWVARKEVRPARHVCAFDLPSTMQRRCMRHPFAPLLKCDASLCERDPSQRAPHCPLHSSIFSAFHAAAWHRVSYLPPLSQVGATELTVGVTRMKAGGMNPAHRHPNCEEVLHVLEGEVEHYCEGTPPFYGALHRACVLCVALGSVRSLSKIDVACHVSCPQVFESLSIPLLRGSV